LVELAVVEEIGRFLLTVSTHGTRSTSCIDGVGHRLRIDEIDVCPAGSAPERRKFDATFRLTSFPEGHGDAVETSTWHARVTFTFVANEDGYVLDAGIPIEPFAMEVTPLDVPHDGDCYGKSQPFIPATIQIP
jgi:hypothetical protein